MSDTPVKTQITGRLSLVSPNGQCKVLISDGTPDKVIDPNQESAAIEAEKKRRAAYQEGWNDCEKRMAAEVAGLKAKLKAFQEQLPAELNGYFSELETQMKDEILELSFKIAEAVIGAEMASRDVTAQVVSDALSPLLTLSGVKLHLNPAIASGEPEKSGMPSGLVLISDPGVKPGEVIVESPQGFIDGTVKGRLKTIREKIIEAHEERKDV